MMSITSIAMPARTVAWLALALGGAAFAQTTPASNIKAACESGPGNIVFVNQPLQISGGTVVVNTPCRFVFGPGGKFIADNASLTFRGALAFEGTVKTEVSFKKTLIAARSVNFDLSERESLLKIDESLVRANAGSIIITAGDLSSIDIAKVYAGQVNSIVATGSFTLNGGEKVSTSLSAGRIQATAGIAATVSGPEASLSLTDSTLVTTAGAINISSPGEKAQFVFAIGQMAARTGITVALTGEESQLKLQGVSTNAGLGSLFLEASAGPARFGVLTVVESQIGVGGSVSMRASVTSEKGEAVVEKNRINAPAGLQIESGAIGTTTMLLNAVASNSLVRAATGPGGSCVAENNRIGAPFQQLCR